MYEAITSLKDDIDKMNQRDPERKLLLRNVEYIAEKAAAADELYLNTQNPIILTKWPEWNK